MANDEGPALRAVRMAPAPTAHHLAEAVKAGHHGASDAVENQPAAHATMRSFADAVATERFPEASALLEQLQDLRDGGVRAGRRAASSRSRR